MNSLIITLIVVLVLAVFLIIFRISNLAGILRSKGKDVEEIDTTANNINAYLFLLLNMLHYGDNLML
jgi:flagellar basal body-associated protein FliL